LYVGVSLSALNRLAQHRDGSHWFLEIAVVKIEAFPDRTSALEAERNAILKENPRHNLRRPKVTEVEAASKANQSRADLVRRLVQFNPLYSKKEAGDILKLGPTAIKRLIESGEIGFVQRPNNKNRIFITGWQIIEYLESVERPANSRLIMRSKNATVDLREMPVGYKQKSERHQVNNS
jgi:predicted GIY-YIG superfamily endonuclease